MLRDRGLVIFILYAFSIDIVLAAKGFQLIPQNISIAVMDESHSPESRELISMLQGPAFRRPVMVESRRALDRMIEDSEVVLSVLIPSDFQKSLYREGASVQVLVDGTQSSASYLSSTYFASVVERFSEALRPKVRASLSQRGFAPLKAQKGDVFSILGSLRGKAPQSFTKNAIEPFTPEQNSEHSGIFRKMLLEEDNIPKGLSPPGSFQTRTRILFNPEPRDDIYEGLVEFFMVITLLGMIVPASVLIREREYGTIEQIMLSPLGMGRLIFFKVLASSALLLSMITMTYELVLQGWLGFPVRATLPEFLLVSATYLLSMLGLAFLIASVAKRFSQIGMLAIVIFAPMILLSGGWVP
ncbi:MAG: ABC transporter permease, partial [Nitrospirae bacterium]